MTVTITLITADDPPKLLIHSRAILAAHSTVFRDLFSLPISSTVQAESTGAAPSNNIAESEAEIAPFLSILTGELGGEFVLSDEQWFSVARLADKYDSLVARVFVENMARACTTDESAGLALTLSTYTTNASLRMQCAFRVLEVETKNRESSSKIPLFLPEHIKQKLARWKESLHYHALRVGLQHCPEDDYHGMCKDDNCNLGAVEQVWLSGMRLIADCQPNQATLDSPFFSVMTEGPEDAGICFEHVEDFAQTVSAPSAPGAPPVSYFLDVFGAVVLAY
ncbi:hypothetical protein NBRC10513v2_000877 [Rhodotorula toruloides]